MCRCKCFRNSFHFENTTIVHRFSLFTAAAGACAGASVFATHFTMKTQQLCTDSACSPQLQVQMLFRIFRSVLPAKVAVAAAHFNLETQQFCTDPVCSPQLQVHVQAHVHSIGVLCSCSCMCRCNCMCSCRCMCRCMCRRRCNAILAGAYASTVASACACACAQVQLDISFSFKLDAVQKGSVGCEFRRRMASLQL